MSETPMNELAARIRQMWSGSTLSAARLAVQAADRIEELERELATEKAAVSDYMRDYATMRDERDEARGEARENVRRAARNQTRCDEAAEYAGKMREALEGLHRGVQDLVSITPDGEVYNSWKEGHNLAPYIYERLNTATAALAVAPSVAQGEPTDTERVNWLERTAKTHSLHMNGSKFWNLTQHMPRASTLRNAIDAAMAAKEPA